MVKRGNLKSAPIKSSEKYIQMRNIRNILSPWLIWIYSVNGFIFLLHEQGSIFKLIFLIMLHGAIIWNYLLGVDFLNTYYAKVQAIDGAVVKTCRAFGVLITFYKLLWYFSHSRKINNTLFDLSIHNQTIRNKYFNPKKTKQGFWISTVSIFIIVRVICLSELLSKSFSGYHWILPIMKDALECEFMQSILGRIHELFFILNKQMFRSYYHIVNIQKFSLNNGNTIRDHLIRSDLKETITLIRHLSLNHHHLIALVNDFHYVLSFSTTVIFTENMVNAAHEFYNFFSSLMGKTYIMSAMSKLSWFLYRFALTSFQLHIWNSLSEEANKTSIILHDIWNTYSEYKFRKKLIYLQYISMRLLNSKLRLTAYGFFPFSRTFLHTMLASSATYVIILMQLQNNN